METDLNVNERNQGERLISSATEVTGFKVASPYIDSEFNQEPNVPSRLESDFAVDLGEKFHEDGPLKLVSLSCATKELGGGVRIHEITNADPFEHTLNVEMTQSQHAALKVISC